VTVRAEIIVGTEVFLLQSPFRLSAHISLHARRTWRRAIKGHKVEVVKQRHLLLPGPAQFTISIDGTPVASAAA
jgi:hypothetical protein